MRDGVPNGIDEGQEHIVAGKIGLFDEEAAEMTRHAGRRQLLAVVFHADIGRRNDDRYASAAADPGFLRLHDDTSDPRCAGKTYTISLNCKPVGSGSGRRRHTPVVITGPTGPASPAGGQTFDPVIRALGAAVHVDGRVRARP